MPEQQSDKRKNRAERAEREDKSTEIKEFLRQVFKKRGLSDDEVAWSRETFGSNELTPPPKVPLIFLFLDKFKDPTIILLSIAAVISIVIGIRTGHFYEGIGIIFAIGLATGIAFLSEYRSGKEFDLLNQVKEERVKVLRDGKFHTVPLNEVVVGDVVLLELGDRVPADGQVIKAQGLYIDESVLTGESRPVRKKTELGPDDPTVGFLRNMTYRGTLVSDGSGEYIVTAVGDDTEMGKIASSLSQQTEQKTPLQERLEVLSQQIGFVGMTVAILIFISLVFKGYFVEKTITGLNYQTLNEVVKFFMVAITIIVVAVPEGLPMMVIMSLALNMRKMAKANCLVKNLVASETIGSVTVICSDKTGTLTQNKMKPVWFYINDKTYDRDSLETIRHTPEWKSIVTNSAVNSTANLEQKNGKYVPVGNATEGSLLVLLHDFGYKYQKIREEAQVINQIPFSSARKLMTTETVAEGNYMVLRKGAPSVILEKCDFIMIDGQKRPIEEYRDSINRYLDEASEKSYRVIAFAERRMGTSFSDETEYLKMDQYALVGLVSIVDPLRPHVFEAVEACHRAGIDVKMVTGDDIKTAIAIAKECKILKDPKDLALSHDDFEKLADAELTLIVHKLKVLARSQPMDKLRLVKSLHSVRETVGVTGDGTNDAPALRQSDVGIAMGKAGTEVAKEAANIILLDDNFKSIVSGIHWGRTIYNNIQRLIQFQLTVNVVALLVALVGPFLGVDLPLTVVQLLWVNIIMDTFAALALASEPPRDESMQEKPRPRDEHIITKSMAGFIGIMGIYMTTILLILLKTNFLGGNTDIERLTILFTTFVLFQFWNEFNCRSLHYKESPFQSIMKNPMFLVVVSTIFIVQVLVVRYGSEVFRTIPLPLETWAKMILLTATVLPVGYFSKWLIWRVFEKPHETEEMENGDTAVNNGGKKEEPMPGHANDASAFTMENMLIDDDDTETPLAVETSGNKKAGGSKKKAKT